MRSCNNGVSHALYRCWFSVPVGEVATWACLIVSIWGGQVYGIRHGIPVVSSDRGLRGRFLYVSDGFSMDLCMPSPSRRVSCAVLVGSSVACIVVRGTRSRMWCLCILCWYWAVWQFGWCLRMPAHNVSLAAQCQCTGTLSTPIAHRSLSGS